MKKIVTGLALVSLILSISACKNTKESENQETKNENEIVNKNLDTLIADGLKISVSEPNKEKKNDGKKMQVVYTFHVKGENVSSSERGLGSIDFVLETKDQKILQPDPDMETFGDDIVPGKTIKGPVSFTLDENQKPEKLMYQISDKTLAEWQVK